MSDVSALIVGKTIQAIEMHEGNDNNPAHIDITLSSGVVLYIAEDEESGLLFAMTGMDHKGTLQ